MDWFPRTIIIAVGVQLSCQLFKFVFYSIRDGRLSPAYLVTAGGIPSAHTAFVTALAVSVGMRRGFSSDVFAIAFVFSAIVIYDAFRLRGHVQRHAQIINKHLLAGTDEEPVSEMVGHSLGEIVAGLLFGGGLAVLANWLAG
jgi:acid phosphatase family membrane protein YuiD